MAILYKPHQASPTAKLPALVSVHGGLGGGGQSRHEYRASLQHLVNHGYAVLEVNFRGSSGDGRSYFELHDRQPGEGDLQDCMWTRRYLESLGWIAADRIGVIGASQGGFMVMAALTREPIAFARNPQYLSHGHRWAWLFLKESGVAFTETRLPMYTDQWDREIAVLSPTSMVPVLRDGALTVWDTWAICAYVHEKVPMAVGWPEAAKARAVARAVSAEMHSGFRAIRQMLPLNCRLRLKGSIPGDELKREVRRAQTAILDCRRRFGEAHTFLVNSVPRTSSIRQRSSAFLSRFVVVGAAQTASRSQASRPSRSRCAAVNTGGWRHVAVAGHVQFLVRLDHS